SLIGFAGSEAQILANGNKDVLASLQSELADFVTDYSAAIALANPDFKAASTTPIVVEQKLTWPELHQLVNTALVAFKAFDVASLLGISSANAGELDTRMRAAKD